MKILLGGEGLQVHDPLASSVRKPGAGDELPATVWSYQILAITAVSERCGRERRRVYSSSKGSAYERIIEPFLLISAPGASRRGRAVGHRRAGTPRFSGA